MLKESPFPVTLKFQGKNSFQERSDEKEEKQETEKSEIKPPGLSEVEILKLPMVSWGRDGCQRKHWGWYLGKEMAS